MNLDDKTLLTWMRMDGYEEDTLPELPTELIISLFHPIPGGVVYWNELISIWMRVHKDPSKFGVVSPGMMESLQRDLAKTSYDTDILPNTVSLFRKESTPFIRQAYNTVTGERNHMAYWDMCRVLLTPHMVEGHERPERLQDFCESFLQGLAVKVGFSLPSLHEFMAEAGKVSELYPAAPVKVMTDEEWAALYPEDAIKCHRRVATSSAN